MRVFILSPQRCGSVTLSEACKHISNYSSGHETRKKLELEYPDQHIEIDRFIIQLLKNIMGK